MLLIRNSLSNHAFLFFRMDIIIKHRIPFYISYYIYAYTQHTTQAQKQKSRPIMTKQGGQGCDCNCNGTKCTVLCFALDNKE
mmetsp:Transcript_10833/g.10484  ORF Transcript_10833/g.10484 Transcript_10833/m.10484 type:complete len:82 (+) Transcript_10833:60-305(+)